MQLSERIEYANNLTNALSEYFDSDVRVHLFGSSITSVGTADSDIVSRFFLHWFAPSSACIVAVELFMLHETAGNLCYFIRMCRMRVLWRP